MYDSNPTTTLPDGVDATLNFTPNTPTNITGWTLSFVVVQNLVQSFPALLTIVPVITNAATGLFTVTITSAQLKALGPNSYRWGVFRTDFGSNDELGTGILIVRETAKRL